MLGSCQSEITESDSDIPPFWESEEEKNAFLQKACIYEVNIRQYSPEGNFRGFMKHLPRLQEMGVDILWLMPIHKIGMKNRKGTLGSYYSVKDYCSVNTNFGSEEDFRALVEEAHKLGMAVILDWVANHTAWDHHWVESNPEFFTKDSLGQMMPPVADWTDVVDLDFENKDLRDSMVKSMQYWIREFNIDGFRCDVAGEVPTDFWISARDSLNKMRPVFMLAEAEKNELHPKAFEMGYAWHLHHLMNEVAKGNEDASVINEYYAKLEFPEGSYKMNFTSNHDENTWNKNAIERMGDNYTNMIVFSFTVPGMPLIYNGQEAGLNKDLEFFEKDEIIWKTTSYDTLFRNLIKLRDEWSLLNSTRSEIDFLEHDSENVLIFKRGRSDESQLLTCFNFGNKIEFIDLENLMEEGSKVKGLFNNEPVNGRLELPPFQNSILILDHE